VILIEDPHDARIAMFRMRDRALNTRADRRDGGSGLFIAEGDLVVERALAAGCVPGVGASGAARVPRLDRRARVGAV